MTRLLSFSLFAALALSLSSARVSAAPVPAHVPSAHSVTMPSALDAGAASVFPRYCDDAHELASSVQAEGRNQPELARRGMAQIIHREAMRLGITICALTRLTNFLAVRHYAYANPASWTATQFANPDPAFIEMAEQVLAGELSLAVPLTYNHFDGRSHGTPEEIQIGQIFFRY